MRARLLALVALLAATPALAFDPSIGGSSVLTWPNGQVTYTVNTGSFSSVSGGDAAVTASFSAWADDPLAVLTAVRATKSGAASIDASTDGFNEVEYITSGWNEGTGVLGITFVYSAQSPQPEDDIVEADMYINGEDFTWRAPTPTPCSGNLFDLRSTVTHEAGHFFGLGHSSESDFTCEPGSGQFDPVLCDATMYYAGGPCDQSGQSLECDDLAGIRYLYPPGGTRRADWVAQGFTSNPAPGNINTGVNVSITGTALNSGSLDTNAGVAAVYVTTAPGTIAGGTRVTTTSPLAVRGPCRSGSVSLSHAFTASETGTRYLVVQLDDTATTSEYDEGASSNLATIGPFTVAVTGPVLAVSANALQFDAVQGGAAPPSQPVTVTNAGSGTLTWTASDDQTWISLSRTSGSQGESFNVTVNPSGRPVGHHEGTITVTSSGAASSPQLITVSLDVANGAVLSVGPTSLTFSASPNGALPASQQLSVTNTGSGTMSWTASDDASWMSVAPASGSDAGNVTVSISTTNLAVGTYTGSVTVTATGATGSPKSIPVTYQVTNASPALDVAPVSLSFAGAVAGASPAPQSLAVTNTGGGTLSFTASANRSWLSVAPASGAAPGSVAVSVDTTGLAAGVQTGTVTITSAGATGSPKSIPVTLTLTTQPSMALTPSTLTFTTPAGTNPASKTVTVQDDGSGSMTYSIADDAPWLSLSPSSGATLAQGASRQHQVSVDVTGLATGTYTATITATSAQADDSPQAVAVTLEVGTRPPLVTAPATLAFTATASSPAPAAQAISVGTSGSASATWTASSDAAWLLVTPAQGTGDGSVSASVSTLGLAAGAYTGHVTITAPALAGSPQRVDVRLDVQPGPRLAVAPASVRWTATRGGALPGAQSLDIANAGTGTLAWTISGAPSWLQVSPPSGSGETTVTLTPTTTNLPAGRQSAVLSVGATGAYDAPRTVDLTYDIVGPALAFTPERVRFELSGGAFTGASSATVQVGGAGGAGGASWTAAANAPWLTVSPSAGTAGDSVTLGLVQPARLRPGVHDAAVIFTSAGAANSPAPVPVSVVVRESPAPAAFPPSLELTARSGGGVQAAAELAMDEAGDRDGAWTVGAHPSWLVPQGGGGAAGDALALAVDPAGLGAGTQAGTLAIVSGGESLTVPVSLEVLAAPAMAALPAELELAAPAGGASAASDVAVTNLGTGAGAFSVSASAPWLRATPSSGTAPATVSVSADATSLAAGTQRATLTITPPTGRAATVPVTLTVSPAGSPRAAITAGATSGCAPLTVTFTDASSGATSRAWRFDDGTTSTLAAPVKTFSEPGEHAVTLTAANASGSSSARVIVVVRQPPLAFAGLDRVIAFEPDGETRLVLETARAAAAAPARLASLQWTTTLGTFEDTGTATSSLERPVLLMPTSRGGLSVTVTLSVTDDAGCSSSDAAVIRVRADIDLDGDTWNELVDNCPGLSNALQGDQDADGLGSTCDSCPGSFDPSGSDADGSGAGDACEPATARTASLSTEIGRACAGPGPVGATFTAAGRLRRAVLVLSGRAPSSAQALGAAAAAGGIALVSPLDPQRLELRVPAGIALPATGLELRVPLQATDDVVAVPCVSATLAFAAGETAATCDDGEIRLRPDADIVPAGAPNGVLDIADVVRMLRSSVGLEALGEGEQARADLAPGAETAGAWEASPDCRVDVSDVVVALRAVVGLVSLPR